MKVHVLLVDDEVDFTENMTTLLKNRGYLVTAVNSGEDALKTLESIDFDVVVLDLKMPGLDGLATLAEMKRRGCRSEVLILTGHGAVSTALQAIRLGAYDYLEKPCEIDELVEKLDGANVKRVEQDREQMSELIRRLTQSPSSVRDIVKKRPTP